MEMRKVLRKRYNIMSSSKVSTVTKQLENTLVVVMRKKRSANTYLLYFIFILHIYLPTANKKLFLMVILHQYLIYIPM